MMLGCSGERMWVSEIRQTSAARSSLWVVEEGGQMLTPDLLLTLHHKLHIDRQRARALQQRLHGLDVDKGLALVVRRAPGEDVIPVGAGLAPWG